VFNVDTKAELVPGLQPLRDAAGAARYLERIQAAYFHQHAGGTADHRPPLLDPLKIQIQVVADKTLPVSKADGRTLTLEEDLKAVRRASGCRSRNPAALKRVRTARPISSLAVATRLVVKCR